MDPHPTSMDPMDTEGASASPSHGHGGGQAQVNLFESPWSLLSMARQLIDQGKPSLALQLILEARRAQGGEDAVIQTLQRARELYRNKIQENAAADELASLFTECAIAESHHPSNPNRPQAPPLRPPPVLTDEASDGSILTMSGRKQIMLDAFSDGSSFICLKCGGLVGKIRKDEHLAYWCGMQ